ncbi:alpha/beta hydrolase [Winogradskyella sp.]|uniref:alpha/beta hydrolase family protein n=1 Tax=Winogradskyella sp. TaxID=1883156 RepID=UPI00262B4CD5|nr:alpha/beta hydrolase [Winogradskyella sp.]
MEHIRFPDTIDHTLKSRMGAEAYKNALEQQKSISEEDYAKIKGLAEFSVRPPFRTPVHKLPSEHGMNQWKDIFFPSADGVPLEGWYIPAVTGESDKLIIINHPFPFSRSGLVGHFGEPFSNVDDLEVDFIAHMGHLSRAGYNIIAYDLRNHGNSGTANNNICGIGRYEWRDCVGVKQYVDNHPKYSKMKVALYSRCTGGNAQIEAIYRRPELFENVVCFFGPMTIEMRPCMQTFANLMDVGQYYDLMTYEQVKLGGYTSDEMTPIPFSSSVKMPYFVSQVKDDSWTDNPTSGQRLFDTIASEDKELFWIEGTTRRFDAYNYFGIHPERMVGFFDKYMK